MAKATNNWMNPSVEMFLARPINVKSNIVNKPAANEEIVLPPNNLTMKNERGITIAEKNADGLRRATYSIVGKVKLGSEYGGL